MEPDWSIKNRKQDGFLRLISAVYDIFAALLSSDADVLVMKRPCRCLTAYSIMPLGGSAKSSLCRTTLYPHPPTRQLRGPRSRIPRAPKWTSHTPPEQPRRP